MGMYLHGIGALIAIVGGVMFVFTVARALLSRDAVRAGQRLAQPHRHYAIGQGVALPRLPVDTRSQDRRRLPQAVSRHLV
jgi:hypothetical protein